MNISMRIIAVLITILLCAPFLFSSCALSGKDASQTDNIVIFENNVCLYTLIRPETTDDRTIAAAQDVFSYIREATGTTPSFNTDWVKRDEDPDGVSDYEILIGHTNRTADDNVLDGSIGWYVGIVGKRIVITASRVALLEEAVEYFKSICVFSDGKMSFMQKDCRLEAIKDPYDGISVTLRVGTYNIRYGADVGFDMSIIAEDITSRALDVVGLQEIDQITTRSNGIDMMKELSLATGYEYYAFSRAIDYGGGEYGTGILSRYPIKEFTVIPLDSGSEEARSAGHAVLDINGTDFDFINTHLSYERKSVRALQLAQIAEIAAGCETFIITADFNTAQTSEFNVIADSTPVNENKFGTFHSSKKAIDNIIISNGWKVIDSGMGPSGHSDHNMLWAELKFERTEDTLDEGN